jgi:hypothetical protein
VSDTVRISRVKGVPHESEQAYKIVKVIQTTPITYVISDLKDVFIKGSFYDQELQKSNQQVFRSAKVLKKKTDKY